MLVERRASNPRVLEVSRSQQRSNLFLLRNFRFQRRLAHLPHQKQPKKVHSCSISLYIEDHLIQVETAPLSTATPLGVPQPNSRPRLVAKTTSLRDSLSKGGANTGRPGGGGPDPNQVWNRNRRKLPISSGEFFFDK